MDGRELSRRDFVKVGVAGTAALVLAPERAAATAMGGPAGSPRMPMRPLGRTGDRVGLFSLGGQATLEQPNRESEAAAIINRALDLGVNYIDTAPAYGRGVSLGYIGEVMKTRRAEVYLATKTHLRTRDESMRLLETNLTLLQTDRLDLWQLHNIMHGEQVDQVFGRGGAMEALIEAKEQGVVRHLGLSGHYDPAPLIACIERFDFDAILMALNPTDPHLYPFAEELLPLANRKQMGVIAMKLACRGRIFRRGGLSSMADSMRYTLSHPVSTVIIGCDTVAQVEENVRIATAFEPMNRSEMERVAGLTAAYAADAAFFKRDGVGWSEEED
jgi:uncharacterized protein